MPAPGPIRVRVPVLVSAQASCSLNGMQNVKASPVLATLIRQLLTGDK